jgi:XTP/dITP diphosphohydrolase
MTEPHRTRIVYVTSSAFKRDEVQHMNELKLKTGTRVGDRFDWDLRDVELKETLEVDLSAMVAAEVRSAYQELMVPCIVEHAGLIFDRYAAAGYPGGLTKPMWNTLGERFVAETQMSEAGAIARAVIGYCDGVNIETFVGETHGHLSSEPRGNRDFYWDTVFIPDTDSGEPGTLTYAEIADTLGLGVKVVEYSQSAKAMLGFLTFREANSPSLWSVL